MSTKNISTGGEMPPVDLLEARKLNCLSYWYPTVERLGIPTPKTKIYRAPQDCVDFLRETLYGKVLNPPKSHEVLIEQIAKGAEEVGYPFFLRSGQVSGKHEWENSCFVPNEESIKRHVLIQRNG